MPSGTVTLTFPKNRLVYLNGDYAPDFPRKIPCTFLVEHDLNIFETLDGQNQVDYRAEAVTSVNTPNIEVQLQRVKRRKARGGKKHRQGSGKGKKRARAGART
jgi:hypothetical protein